MKLRFEVTKDFYDNVIEMKRKKGEKFTSDHLDKRAWQLVKAGVAKQIEEDKLTIKSKK